MDIYLVDDNNDQHRLIPLRDAAKRLGIKYHTLKAYLLRDKKKPLTRSYTRNLRVMEIKDSKFIYNEDLPE